MQPQKPLQHRFIRISSEDRASGSTSASRFFVTLPSTGRSIDNITSYSLKYATCPNVFTNIRATNNLIRVSKLTGPVTYNVSVPVGQYTASGFITALQTAINAAIPDTVAITLDALTNVLTFTWTGDSYQIQPNTSTISDVIGNSTLLAFGTTSVMSGILDLSGVTDVWIHSRTLNQSGLTEADGSYSVLGVIPFSNVPYGAFGHVLEPDVSAATINFQPFKNKQSFRTIDIVLRTREGEVLVLPPNMKFSCLLKAYYDSHRR